MINHDQVETRLRKDEAYRTIVYADSRGYPTGGIGHKILKADNLVVGDSIDPGLIEDWFNRDYGNAVTAATKNPWFGGMTDPRQQIIVCLEFNMGPGVFGEFHETQAHLAAKAYDLAADSLLDSAWATEVGFLKHDSRGATYARILSSGIWE
jgi:GH24 family phage-related lysozyme (muramidase)